MSSIANKHTPGPWRVSNAGTCPAIDSNGRNITLLTDLFGAYLTMDDPANAANAALIAAAPDLLAALEQIERLSREADGGLVDVRAMLGDIARVAIAKTERRVS